MSTIAENIAKVRERIREAAQASQRDPQAVGLLAVSKTKPAAAVREAHAAGQRDFGENYLQEALAKQAELSDLDLVWHFIGPIQSNKTRAIAEHFDWVHSVDRLKIAQRLSEQRPADLPPLNICIQVNVSGEASKSGCAPADLPALAAGDRVLVLVEDAFQLGLKQVHKRQLLLVRLRKAAEVAKQDFRRGIVRKIKLEQDFEAIALLFHRQGKPALRR